MNLKYCFPQTLNPLEGLASVEMADALLNIVCGGLSILPCAVWGFWFGAWDVVRDPEFGLSGYTTTHSKFLYSSSLQ